MTDKGTTDDIAQRYIAVVDERDDLRSEVITLEWQLSEATNEIERMRAVLAEIRALVDTQAEDDALWFLSVPISEAYLQQELRRLHALCERVCPT